MSRTDLDRCKKCIRSVLLASKGGLPVSLVLREYKNLFEEDIPFTEYKYPSLEIFLRSIPDVCSLRERRGQVVVEGVGTLATNHIKNLVQNTDKNKRNLRSGGWREPQQAVLSRVSPVRQRSLQPCQSPCPSDSPARMKQNPCQAFKAEPNSARKGNLKSTEETFQVWSGQVKQILRGYPSGASQEQVEEIFESQYRSKLPHIWTRTLTKAGLIDVDTENKVNTKPLLFLATDILTEEVIPTVRPIRKEWDVLVNAVDSKRQEAWVTLQDEASLQIRQQLRMKLRLQLESLREEILHPGQYLSGRVQQGEVERLQVVKVNRLNQTCRCFLLDVGTEVELSWSSLSPLQQDCRTTPAQAVKVRLAGFNKYTNSQFAEFVMDKLVGKRFVARDVGFSISNIPELRIFDDHEKSEVQFVDEAVTKMKELRLDGLDRQRQEQDGVGPQLQTPILPEEGDFIDCKVTRVVSAGEIWVQNCSAVRQYDVMKRSLTAFYTLGNGRAVLNPQDGSIVAVRVGKDWFRAKIIFKMRAAFPAGKVARKMLVKLVDTGKVLLVKLSQMRSLEKCFAELPVQALMVKLDGVERQDQATNMLLEKMCLRKSLVGHVIRREFNDVYLNLYDTNEEQDVNINVVLERYTKDISVQ